MERAPGGVAPRRPGRAWWIAGVDAAGAPAARAAAVLRAQWPLWALAVSLNGFFLYLALLDAVDVRPRTPLTAGWYAFVGSVLALAAWSRQRVLRERLASCAGACKLCLGAGTALAGWYVLNAALFSDAELAPRLVALLVLWTLPTAVMSLTLGAEELGAFARSLVAVGLALVPIEAVAVVRSGGDVFRFSPIAELDVISAGLVPALSAVAAPAPRPSSRAGRLGQAAAIVLLVAAAVVPGSRGPVVALAAAAVAVAFVTPRRAFALPAAAFAAGLAVGVLLASNVGTHDYLVPRGAPDRLDAPRPEEPAAPAEPRTDSPGFTVSIRFHWMEDALREVPERPLLGHGVGMFVDRTPEAKQLGVEGQRVYPHNTFVQAAHALGAVGLAVFLVFLGSAAWILFGIVRRRLLLPPVAVPLLVGFAAFAFVRTNVSGEIGSDALLWASAALAVSLRGDTGILSRR